MERSETTTAKALATRQRNSKEPCYWRPLVTVLLLVAPSCSLVFSPMSRIICRSAVAATAARSRLGWGLAMVTTSTSRSTHAVSKKPTAAAAAAAGAGSRSTSREGGDRKRNRGKARRKYKRKRIPESERELKTLREERQAEYEQIVSNAGGSIPSIFSFDSLFPEPVLDEETIQRDLFGVRDRDSETAKGKKKQNGSILVSEPSKMRSYGGSSMMRVWREPRLSSACLPYDPPSNITLERNQDLPVSSPNPLRDGKAESKTLSSSNAVALGPNGTNSYKVDRDLTQLVENRIYGYRRTRGGDLRYDSSLMGDGAVQFRDGIRLGNPLRVNADRLNYLAKKDLQHGRVEEAQELYERAIDIDPRDGRAYLGLSRCAQRRRDFKLAREYLQTGIANSVSVIEDDLVPDRGANPFLLQALGCLEERLGSLSEAEACYIEAAKSRPSHAAAWVSLAQLRTRKLGQGVHAGRVCYETAEKELKKAGARPSSYVYTAWANLEFRKGGNARRARQLFNKALAVDPKCSTALQMLGVMETACGNWKEAQDCFDKVLEFDQKNTRVLQAYAIMESKRPDGDSRKAIGLFERALKYNPRDAGVIQPYALYVAQLGDVDAARDLLRRGTKVNKRHAAVWQAWGVLETRHGSAEEARNIFQQGIWACAQLVGGQSGGYRCARLWQAWGVLEAKEGDRAAARRCFSRALDADGRNVPAITAWALMEEQLGNVSDARSIFERALKKFAAGSPEKIAIWRNFELMEQRLGHTAVAQQVYRRYMREAMMMNEETSAVQDEIDPSTEPEQGVIPKMGNVLKQSNNEVEVIRWDGGLIGDGSLGGEVWLNDKAIESKIRMKKRRNS